MNFDYNEEQQLLADSLRRYLQAQYSFEQRKKVLDGSAEVWAKFAEMGLLALPLSPDYGGFGGGANAVVTIEWEISFDGVTPWKPLKSYRWTFPAGTPIAVFAGRFGTAPGAGILTVDPGGTGNFFAPLETRVGAKPDWTSTFRY